MTRLRREGQTDNGFTHSQSPRSAHVPTHPIGSNIRVYRHPLKPTAASLQRGGSHRRKMPPLDLCLRRKGAEPEDGMETRREGWEPTCNIAKVSVNSEIRTVKPVQREARAGGS